MLIVFLLILALTARATRLLVDDGITDPFRAWLLARSFKGVTVAPTGEVERTRSSRAFGWLVKLFNCPWCVSVWAAGASTLAIANLTPAHAPFIVWVALAAGASYLTGVLAVIVYKLTDE